MPITKEEFLQTIATNSSEFLLGYFLKDMREGLKANEGLSDEDAYIVGHTLLGKLRAEGAGK